jgi:methionyl-tRNA formyltransferase
MSDSSAIRFAFFGTDGFSVRVCERLAAAGLVPTIVITAPDRPAGRKKELTPPPLKLWALARGINVLQPEKLTQEFADELRSRGPWDCFAVASYGRIIPQRVLDIPARGSLNVHPSLLPLLRGASPIESAILGDHKKTGVSIILMDAQMDHGPILLQQTYQVQEWPPRTELEPVLADIGGDMLAKAMIGWVANNGSIVAVEQDHDAATFTKKIEKVDAEIIFPFNTGSAYDDFRKIQAYAGWPQAHFYFTKENGARIRVIIKKATFANGMLAVDRVLPEASHEMSWEDFSRGFLK